MAARANGDFDYSESRDSHSDTYCDLCWDLEKSVNLPTDNRLSNTEWAKDVIDDLIKHTDADGYMHKQAPAWLDTVFSNKCNFACMGCDSTASTTIGKYDIAYQHRDGNFVENNNVPLFLQSLLHDEYDRAIEEIVHSYKIDHNI